MPEKKPKPKHKANPKLSQKEKFIEFAKSAEVDETGETFRRALGKLVPVKRKGSST
jgi:hypothetical protein